MAECPFIPPYPTPLKTRAGLARRFVTGWNSWIHTLFEGAYVMKMGSVRLPRLRFFIINDLPLAHRVLDDADGTFPKHAMLTDLLDPLLGNSLFTTNGAEWAADRAMVNPAFAHTNLRRVFGAMLGAADDLIALIRARDLSRPIDIDPLMTHVAADVIYRTLFSQSLRPDESAQLYAAFTRFQARVQPAAMLRLYRLPLFAYQRRANRSARAIHALFRPIIAARLAAYQAGEAPASPDILQALLEARHAETGTPFTIQALIDQVSLIFFAGHETAASVLSWTFYLLSESPELQERLAAEIATATGGGPLGLDSLRALEGVRNLFKEALRLYPPISFLLRGTTKAEKMRGKAIAPGDLMVISPWLIQRNPDNWTCPHAFDPDRFARPENAEAAKQAYLPFGRGPRICVGAGFAQQEAMLVIASVIRAFRLSYPPGPKPEPVSRLSLRPKAGVRVLLTPRGAGRA